MTAPPGLADAIARDGAEPLRAYRERFERPVAADGTPLVYLCGNSLGLMPTAAREAVGEALDQWARRGVDAHFDGPHPWYSYAEEVRESLARVVGAHADEVVAMNSLTVNLHLLFASFYRPEGSRTKVLIEDYPFPSDRYAVATHVDWHGLDPSVAVVQALPRSGEALLRTEDIESLIAERGDEIALVWFPGVSYYTGQRFDIPRITAAAHERGCMVGFDLAHSVGNVPLALHEWGVDIAVWCSYKYLNAGPGATGGCFVHRRHARSPDRPRLAGWWGNDPATRFDMDRVTPFVPQDGAGGWQVSNPSVFALAPLRASLEIFDEVGGERLRAKSLAMTAYLERLIGALASDRITCLTPTDPEARGCQLSLRIDGDAREVFDRLVAAGVVGDFRAPDVIRASPVPLYNGYADCWRFAAELGRIVGAPLPEEAGAT